MIASRLASIAQDIAAEYNRFQLTALLTKAAEVAAQRPNMNGAQYRDAISALKQKAQEILNQNVFRTYPLDTLKLLTTSEISSILPATIANMIIAGFPARKEDGISSAEISMYLAEAQQLLAQINGFLSFSQRLKIETYEIPDQKVALDLKIPRHLFANELGSFEKHLSNFSKFFESITELTTGSREAPRLLYISTSDPIISFIVIGSTAYGILKFYKLLLEVAEKHLTLYKAVSELRKSKVESVDVPAIEKSIDLTISSSTALAIDQAFELTAKNVPEARQMELKTEIKIHSGEIVKDIAGGARLFVSIESQQQVSLISGNEPDKLATIRDEIEQHKQLESKLDAFYGLDTPLVLDNFSTQDSGKAVEPIARKAD